MTQRIRTHPLSQHPAGQITDSGGQTDQRLNIRCRQNRCNQLAGPRAGQRIKIKLRDNPEIAAICLGKHQIADTTANHDDAGLMRRRVSQNADRRRRHHAGDRRVEVAGLDGDPKQ